LDEYEDRCKRYSEAAGQIYELQDAAGVCAVLDRCTFDPEAVVTYAEVGMVVRTLLRVFTSTIRACHKKDDASGDEIINGMKVQLARATSDVVVDLRLALRGASGVPTSKWFAYLKGFQKEGTAYVLKEMGKGGASQYVAQWKTRFAKIIGNNGGEWKGVVEAVGNGPHVHAGIIRSAQSMLARIATKDAKMSTEELCEGIAYMMLIGEFDPKEKVAGEGGVEDEGREEGAGVKDGE
jgi:hypothetical protein